MKSLDAATRKEIATALKAVDPVTFGGIADLHEMHKASLVKWAHGYGITDVDNPLGGGGGTSVMSDAKLDEIKRILEEQSARQERTLNELKRSQDDAPQKFADALRPMFEGLTDGMDRLVGNMPTGAPATPVGATSTTPPPTTAGETPTTNVSKIVGKTLDEAHDLLPTGYAITSITRTYHRRVLLDDIISYTVDGHNISVVVSDGPDPDDASAAIRIPERPRPLERVRAEPIHSEESGHGGEHGRKSFAKRASESFASGLTLGIWRPKDKEHS